MSEPMWYLRSMWPTALATIMAVYAWRQVLVELVAPPWDRAPAWWLVMLLLVALAAVFALVGLVWAGLRRGQPPEA